ncbi:MAG TPA: DNA polymerase domain-containing protein [Methanomassiliicoccales archaeon]|nr:DNA polymerase domain-containing protein [Methanomassiliicoccales archaeon]
MSGSWDVRLITATYKRAGENELVIEMFGKTRENRSITVRYTGFLPYFHVFGASEDLVAALRKDQDVVKVEWIDLFHRGQVKRSAQVTVRYPGLVPEFRDKIKQRFEVLAADIPFHRRFIFDFDMGTCIRVFGKESTKDSYCTDIVFDLENVDGRPHFENIAPFAPDIKIMAFDVENSITDGHLYTICYFIRDHGGLHPGEPIWGTEKEIVEQFTAAIQKEDPDVLTGYNIDGYDIPTIMERARKAGIRKLEWGRDKSEPRNVYQRFWRLNGRLVADAWWAVKKDLKPKQETLNAVAMELLGEQKLEFSMGMKVGDDYDPRRIDKEWQLDRNRILAYCTRDAELSLRVLEKLGTIRKTMDMATVSRLPLDDVLNIGSSFLIDSILIRAADRHVPRVGVPMTGSFEEVEAIEGGYVHEIQPGLYHWVCVLDFKSMYPSLIIAKNICFTTIDSTRSEGEIVAPTGVRFMSKEQRPGLLPSILQDLMRERDETKRKMKQAASDEERRYYDGLQQAIKILMNSFYGVFASSFYRFTDRQIGSSITAFARETTKGIIASLEKESYRVIYSDTDSIFVQCPTPEKEAAVQFGKQLAERYSVEGGQLEFEKIMEPLFSHGKKKRYVGRVVWPNQEPELLVRGYETRRTDSFDMQSELLTEVFEKVLDENQEEAVRIARSKVQEVLAGKVPIEKLVISRSVREFSAYENPERLAHVQAAQKLIAIGYEFVPGMKVSWIVTNSRKTPQEIEPYVFGRKFEGTPDWKYYAERLAQSVARATENFGWKEKDLLMGSQQANLFSGAFGGGEEEPAVKRKEKDGPKKTDKRLSLDDYFG